MVYPTEPSAWVARYAKLVSPGPTLDVACGAGRHARLLAALGHPVEAVDRDVTALAALRDHPGISVRCADLEAGPWPYAPASFAGIVVVSYLHRPLFPWIIASLCPGGVLLYETFMAGNERFRRPSNPDFLLRPGELLDLVHGRLQVVAFEQGEVHRPKRAMIQRLCAVHGTSPVMLP